MTHYASSSKNAGGCNRCGRRTPNRLCRDCERDERRETALRADREDSTPDTVRYRCTACEHVYESAGLSACPECGAYRCRAVEDD